MKIELPKRSRSYRRNRTPAARFAASRNQTLRFGKEWSLTREQFGLLISLPCTYCEGLIGKCETGRGLDRIDNSIGYVIGNVLPCCGICNGLRSNRFTVDETRIMVQALIRFRIKFGMHHYAIAN